GRRPAPEPPPPSPREREEPEWVIHTEPEGEDELDQPADQGEEGGGILGRTVGAIIGVGSPDESGQPDEGLNLNSATFEELRELGFSVTQATRVLTHRERQGGFNSVEELRDVPGMPDELLGAVTGRPTLYPPAS